MPIHSRLSVILACLPVIVGISCVQAGDDPAKLGPKIGSNAPNFTLMDQHGKNRKLSELTKEGHVALVFYRSVVW